MSESNQLFNDFGPVSRAEWIDKATVDLKGADFNRKLVWRTYEGFEVQPFYTPEDMTGTDKLTQLRAIFAQSSRSWVNYTEIHIQDEKKANEEALYAMKYGAQGILFHADIHKIDLEVLLKGIDIKTIHVSFALEAPSEALVEQYFNYAKKEGVDLKELKGFVQADVLESWTTRGVAPDFDELAQMIKLTAQAPDFKGLAVQSASFVNAGSNVSQELAFAFNKMVELFDRLSEKDIEIKALAGELIPVLAIGGDYFFEIAKMRAFRLLAASILKAYGVDASQLKIVSVNSLWSKSLYDPYVNMLRNTTEGMAAVMGGCDALLTRSHDSSYQEPSNFSRRIALNVSNLLKEETYLDKVVDPAAGSYYIENLTLSLTDKALEIFKEIESKGGFVKAFESNTIQSMIAEVKAKKEKDIAQRKNVFVGINRYPNLNEKVPFIKPDGAAKEVNGIKLLVPQRAARLFEDLRQRTQEYFENTGKLPKVYLACFGNLAMRKARATFAADFFGTAGFEMMGEFFFDNIENAAKESAASDADIVVMCGADDDYIENGEAFAKTFKAAANDKQLVLAGNPADMIEKLKAAGVDEFIHVRTNAIEALNAFQEKLLATV